MYGFVLRAYQFDKQSFWMDEGISVVHAQAILKQGTPLLENGRMSWDSFPVHYLMATGLSLSPDPQFGARIWSIVLGTACIPLFCLLNRRLFGSPWQALIAAFLMAILTCEVAWSRQARLYIYLQFFSLTSLLLLYSYLESRGLICGLLAGVFALLAVFTHRAGYLVLLIGGLGLLLTKLPSGRSPVKAVLGFVAIIALVLEGIVLVPGHSNFGDAGRKLMTFGGQNYLIPYLQYFSQQLSILLSFFALGALATAYRFWRKCFPLLFGMVAYCYVLAFAWRYFAHRYAFPIVFILLIFAAYAIALPLGSRGERSRNNSMLRGLFCLILFIAAIALSNTILLPRKQFLLGYTEPQPNWKRGFEMIAAREAMLPDAEKQMAGMPTTISALPYFHNVYLGQHTGTKYYLPISYTGFAGDMDRLSAYTSATSINSLDALLRLKGYVILDDFSMRMLANPEIQNYLRNRTPNVVIKSDFNLFIWVLPDPT
jgi:4-amino-4-deoxy-L-arabinose transferase-like glycosyltransferase